MIATQLHQSKAFPVNGNPTPKIWEQKIPPLNQCAGNGSVENVVVELPQGGWSRLEYSCRNITEFKKVGLAMVASLLWTSRRLGKDGRSRMRLVKAAALRFVDRVEGCSNPATFVATAWGCEQATCGRNRNGKVANSWYLPPWANGNGENIRVRVSPRQLECWNRRHEILRECQDKANPHAAIVRKNLMLTEPGASFYAAVQQLTKSGERKAVRTFLASPSDVNVTCDNDVQSHVSRMPETVRETLLIDGLPVMELDVKSAHAVLLGMFYAGETGEDWLAEKARFDMEALRGFPSIYGTGKRWKIKFLSALNQSARVARHASEGYRELERRFPLLAGKLARMRGSDGKAVGRKLRVTLAEIVKDMLIENDKDGIKSIPVVDSAVVAMPEDLWERHRAEFRTAWRLGVPIAEATGTAALIVGSDGESYRFW